MLENSNTLFIEATKSTLDKDYKSKGKKKLSSFKQIHITEEVINRYKKEYPSLKHVRCKDTKEYICDGYIWMNGNELVATVGSCTYRDDKTKWVVSLEVMPKYRGYGLSEQVLDYAVKTMKCTYLSVNKNNEIAKKVYDKYGFKVYKESDSMYYMALNKNINERRSYKMERQNGYVDKRLAIFESFADGSITEAERDDLLDALDVAYEYGGNRAILDAMRATRKRMVACRERKEEITAKIKQLEGDLNAVDDDRKDEIKEQIAKLKEEYDEVDKKHRQLADSVKFESTEKGWAKLYEDELYEERVFGGPIKKKIDKLKEIKDQKPSEYDGPKEIKEFIDKNYNDIIECAKILEAEPSKLRKNEINMKIGVAGGVLTHVGSTIASMFLMLKETKVTEFWGSRLFATGPIVTVLSISIAAFNHILMNIRMNADREAMDNLTKIKNSLNKVDINKLPDEYKKKIANLKTAIDDTQTEIEATLKLTKESVDDDVVTESFAALAAGISGAIIVGKAVVKLAKKVEDKSAKKTDDDKSKNPVKINTSSIDKGIKELEEYHDVISNIEKKGGNPTNVIVDASLILDEIAKKQREIYDATEAGTPERDVAKEVGKRIEAVAAKLKICTSKGTTAEVKTEGVFSEFFKEVNEVKSPEQLKKEKEDEERKKAGAIKIKAPDNMTKDKADDIFSKMMSKNYAKESSDNVFSALENAINNMDVYQEAKIVSKDKYSKTTDLKFKGVSIEVRSDGKDNLDQLDKDIKALSGIDGKIKDAFDKLLELGQKHWDIKFKTTSQLMSKAHLDTVSYTATKGDKETGYFSLWYNGNSSHQSEEFFGYHSFVIYVYVNNGKVTEIDSDLAG